MDQNLQNARVSAPGGAKPANATLGNGAGKYENTLNLPRTSFPMKADLVQREPASVEKWRELNLYDSLVARNLGRRRLVIHDGPPYPNGSIHLGHVLNKTLKDICLRYSWMKGLDCRFIPGWDCHGLPIEHKVLSELSRQGIQRHSLTPLDVRSRCHQYSSGYVDSQRRQFQRILTVADYEHPYKTLLPAFEAATMRALGELVGNGLVYRGRKAVYWSPANQTALADAELEYHDRQDPAICVRFPVCDCAGAAAIFGADRGAGGRTSFLIWTTTPWSLLANQAIAVNAAVTYVLAGLPGGERLIVAESCLEKVRQMRGDREWSILGKATGAELAGLSYVPPYYPSGESLQPAAKVIIAEHVTAHDGTGIVHIAPSHGADDYKAGLVNGLHLYCPVNEKGRFDDSVMPELRGKPVLEAAPQIIEDLTGRGLLWHAGSITHSYPHDWRSKTPVIVRATEQWFVAVDKEFNGGPGLRERAIKAVTEDIEFTPVSGRDRMLGMLRSRPDWCISRQRSWGIPIPAFVDDAGQTLLTKKSVEAVARCVAQQGSDSWFQLPPERLLADYDVSQDGDAPAGLEMAALRKCEDILDVWFESGATWYAVHADRPGDLPLPVDFYLEGSDQHRGWFQSSLLIALGTMEKPPYKRVVTHGFLVGADGQKLSKSKGDTVDGLIGKYGAEILRLWVASSSFENDVKVDERFFKEAGETYRKVRNTFRFMLSNLYDFAPASEETAGSGAFHPDSLESWILARYAATLRNVQQAMESLDFQGGARELIRFCSQDLSSVYFEAIKDRLYCDNAASNRRREAQRALFISTDAHWLPAPRLLRV